MRKLEELLPSMTARSVALSLLLGMESGSLAVGTILRIVEPLGFSAPAMRTALSRMVANGDLEMSGGVYALGPKHRMRLEAHEEDIAPKLQPDEGSWCMAVISITGRPASSRALTRDALRGRRYAELREGVWLRPNNLVNGVPSMPEIEVFTAQHENEQRLVNHLWDLATWSAETNQILQALQPGSSPRLRFTAAAAAVRHLRNDPALPQRLRPDDWPTQLLLDEYKAYRHYIARLASEES